MSFIHLSFFLRGGKAEPKTAHALFHSPEPRLSACAPCPRFAPVRTKVLIPATQLHIALSLSRRRATGTPYAPGSTVHAPSPSSAFALSPWLSPSAVEPRLVDS